MRLGRASGDDFYNFKPDKFVGGRSSLRTWGRGRDRGAVGGWLGCCLLRHWLEH